MSVTCWAPAHFTGSQIAYTNEICRQRLLSGKTFLAFEEYIPVEDNAEQRHIIPKKIQGLQDDENDQMKSVLIAQVIAAVVGFLMLTQVI